MYLDLLLSNIQTGLITFLLGLAMVFFGICVLIFFVWLIGNLLKKNKAPKVQKPANQPVEIATKQEDVQDGDIPANVRVAIMAAIYAYYNQNNSQCEFIVKKIKRRS